VCAFCTGAAAAELQARTSHAYHQYLDDVTQRFIKRVHGGSGPLGVSSAPSPHRSLQDGEIIAQPGDQDGIIAVPGGLIHHWIGATFIEGITLADALRVSHAYDDYHVIYKPVIGSRFLGRDGDIYRVALRIKEGSAGISAVLDLTARVQYVYPSRSDAYSISRSEEIREVKDAGTPNERLLPAGKDSGYLWCAATLNRLVQREGGVVVEMETLGLSRSFPPMLGWIIEPIARRLGRKSVEASLLEFRTAVRMRKRDMNR
jgi:hypothetical protein